MRRSWNILATMFLVVLAWPLAAKTELEEDIRGPKPLIEVPQAEAPVPWLTYSLWGLFTLLAAGGLMWWLLKKRAVALSPEDRAREELDALGKDGSALAAGDFAAVASQVVRVFIERRFGVAAPRRTTEEFLQELAAGNNAALHARMEPLRGFLKSCDMAKFAAADLDVGKRGELVAKARDFIEVPAPVGNEAAG